MFRDRDRITAPLLATLMFSSFSAAMSIRFVPALTVCTSLRLGHLSANSIGKAEGWHDRSGLLQLRCLLVDGW
jgi:hypothetical protein